MNDDGLHDRIAAALRDEYAQSLRPAPPKPPAAPVPDWLFGPRHREMDALRQKAAEEARQILPVLAEPEAPAPVERCPWCGAVTS